MTDLIDPPAASDAVTTDARTPDARTPDGAGPRWWRDGFRPLVMRLHFTVGVVVGPFVLIAALTGLLYTMTPQLEQIVHGRELSVPVGTTTVPLAQQVDIARGAVPDGTLTEVRPPRTPDGTTRVTFATPDVEADHARTAFIDPYTGEVRGVLTTFGEWLPLRAWFDDLHRNLLLGTPGRVYSELAASWLWVLAVSGLGTWVVRARRRQRLRRTLLPTTAGKGRTRLMSWHGAVGVWASVGLLFLAVTGLTWSQFAGGNISTLRSELSWTTPGLTATLAPGSPAVAPIDLGSTVQRVLDAGRDAGLTGPVAVNPGEAGEPWSVSQVQRSWPVLQDTAAVDPSTGAVLERIDFADWPVAAKLAEWGVDAHMGLLFGLPNQIVLAALALGIVCLVVWGYRMWWHRRPTRQDRTTRIAKPLGSGRTPSQAAVVVVGGIGLLTALLFPLLGVSLVAFLLFDVVRSMLQRRNDAAVVAGDSAARTETDVRDLV